MMKKHKHLTIEEKRDWLADIFRDVNGEYSQADKFKAMVEDTRLAELQEEKKAHQSEQRPSINIFEQLPPPRAAATNANFP